MQDLLQPKEQKMPNNIDNWVPISDLARQVLERALAERSGGAK